MKVLVPFEFLLRCHWRLGQSTGIGDQQSIKGSTFRSHLVTRRVDHIDGRVYTNEYRSTLRIELRIGT